MGYRYKDYGTHGVPAMNYNFNILKEYLDKKQVKPDGNCMLRALSGGLWDNENHHKNIRASMKMQMKQYPELYSPFVEGDYNEYINKIGKNSQWYV